MARRRQHRRLAAFLGVLVLVGCAQAPTPQGQASDTPYFHDNNPNTPDGGDGGGGGAGGM